MAVALSRSSAIKLDMRWEANRIQDTVRKALTVLGGLDALVVSSGMGAGLGPLSSDGDVKDLFQVNVFGPMAAYKAALRPLLKSQGKAMFVSSTCSRRPGSGGFSVYGSTKAALNGWILSEARRAAKKNVSMFAISPGWFESEMTADLLPPVRAAATKGIPMGRFGEVSEVATFACSLLEQDNWITAGQIFECSGGA